MRSFLAFALVFAALPGAFAQDLVAKTDAKTPADELKCFTLPPGFEAQLVASEPDIQKPMQLAFDSRGRLWVTTSHHYPFAVAEGKGTDKLFVLSDFGDDGKAKKVQVFDEKLNIPIGVLPLPDGKSVIVSECGKIWKLTDTDGDGKADQREVLFSGFGFRDTHGMTNSFTLLPDGWVYACHGFSNDSKVKGKDGHEITMNSGHTFRFKPDGSRIEIFTRGQVNPFGMCIDPWLNLYTADCHSKPMTQLVRGAYYDSFNKPHDGLGYAPHVINHMHGSTGLCGLVYYAADQYPKEWQNVMFVGNCVTSRINCDRIEWKGATPAGKELPDFLSSSDPWFRPVDIKLAPDGALYVSDFYNKIIGHYEVDLKHPGRDKDRGRIWRIVWKGKDGKGAAPKWPRQDWSKAEDTELLADFGHPNTTVRLMAANEAIQRSNFLPDGKILLEDSANASLRAGLLAMVRERIRDVKAEDYTTFITYAEQNPDKIKLETLTGLVVKSLTSRTAWGETERTLANNWFKTFDSIRVKRACVDGFTAHPHADFVPTLLKFLPTIAADDVYFKHAAKVALRNCLQQPGGVAALGETTEWSRVPETVEVLLAVGTRDATAKLVSALPTLPEGKRVVIAEAVGRTLPPQEWTTLSQFIREQSAKMENLQSSLELLQAVFAGSEKSGNRKFEAPGIAEEFQKLLEKGLAAKGKSTVLAAQVLGRWARQFGANSVSQGASLATKLVEAIPTADAKLPLIEALAALDVTKARPFLRQVVGDITQPVAVRQQFAPLLLTTPTPADATTAKDAIKTAPYSLALTLAVGLAGDAQSAELLLNAVKTGEAPARLLQEKLVLDRLKTQKVTDLDKRIADLTKGLLPTDKRIEDLIKHRGDVFRKTKFDPAKGKEIFVKNCAICHQLNNEGAKVGPQLDGVGIRGLERLLEDTLDPNRNVDAAFKSTTLVLTDGRSPSGLVREDGQTYVLIDGMGKENRFPKVDVEKVIASNLSAMPANVDAIVSETDYYHLLAYLLQQKPK